MKNIYYPREWVLVYRTWVKERTLVHTRNPWEYVENYELDRSCAKSFEQIKSKMDAYDKLTKEIDEYMPDRKDAVLTNAIFGYKTSWEPKKSHSDVMEVVKKRRKIIDMFKELDKMNVSLEEFRTVF